MSFAGPTASKNFFMIKTTSAGQQLLPSTYAMINQQNPDLGAPAYIKLNGSAPFNRA